MQNNLYSNLNKIRISIKTIEITKIVDQYNIKSVKFFSSSGVWVGAGGGGVGSWRQVGGGVVGRWGRG